MLETAVRKVFKIRISHNRIHMYLKAADLAHEDVKKEKRRKWVRYERKHSLSAGHIDWHESGWSDLKVCVIIDDASRMILAGGEFKNINTKNSKSVVDELVERYWWLCPMRELILDHGAEFGVHRVPEDGLHTFLLANKTINRRQYRIVCAGKGPASAHVRAL